jgi:sensor histidine kinase YesM
VENSVKQPKGYVRAFVIAWSAVITVQFVVLYFIYGIDFYAAWADAVVFNLSFALAGYVLWFVVRYNLKEKTAFMDLFSQHFFAAVVIVGAWFFISQYILLRIFDGNPDYVSFLSQSVPLRIITGVFYYVVYVLIYYLILYYEDLQERLQREAEWQRLVKEAELAALKSQINPHFLFNSLNSIS